MLDLYSLTIIGLTFFIAGGVKGIVGLGLPTVILGLLTAILDLTTAMTLLLVPAFITNVWQGFVGGFFRKIVLRLWPFLGLAMVSIWFGTKALVVVNPLYLSILLAILLIIYSSFNLLGCKVAVSPTREKWLGPPLGVLNGLLTGMTGSSLVPGVMFLQGIGLPRDMFVQAMGLLFLLSSLGLATGLQSNNLLTKELAIASTLAVIPALIGMKTGKMVRQKMSENQFKRFFFISVLVLGCFIIVKALYFFSKTNSI